MRSKTKAIGDPIQSRCPKCRKTTTHTIVAVAGELPNQIQCNSCQHTSVARKPVDRRPVDTDKAARETWAALRPGMDTTQAIGYSMTTAYKVKSLINHPMFGFGQVQRLAGLQKMVVLFADGEKVMRCK